MVVVLMFLFLLLFLILALALAAVPGFVHVVVLVGLLVLLALAGGVCLMMMPFLSTAGPVRADEGRARAVDQTDQRVANAWPRARRTGDA